MSIPLSKETKRQLYEMRYPKNTVLRLTAPIEDPYSPKPVGAEFISSGIVDSELQLHGHWRDGGSIAIIIEKDHFEIVT